METASKEAAATADAAAVQFRQEQDSKKMSVPMQRVLQESTHAGAVAKEEVAEVRRVHEEAVGREVAQLKMALQVATKEIEDVKKRQDAAQKLAEDAKMQHEAAKKEAAHTKKLQEDAQQANTELQAALATASKEAAATDDAGAVQFRQE